MHEVTGEAVACTLGKTLIAPIVMLDGRGAGRALLVAHIRDYHNYADVLRYQNEHLLPTMTAAGRIEEDKDVTVAAIQRLRAMQQQDRSPAARPLHRPSAPGSRARRPADEESHVLGAEGSWRRGDRR